MSSKPVILVTAGSAGLGAAAVRYFHDRGYLTAINYNSNSERAKSLCTELNATLQDEKRQHVIVQADLASKTDVQRLVGETYAAFGRIDVIFSNGGWTRFTDTTSLEDNTIDEDWDHAFDMNVKSHLWLLQAARKHLDVSEGCFITTSSVAGVQGMGSSLAYSATKAAQLHMVRGLAAMVAPRIRVNSVSPGLLETDWAKRFTAEQKEGTLKRNKLGRFVTVEDVAAQVYSLADSKSMTGVNIVVDAGFTLG